MPDAIGRRLKRLRQARGLSLRALASLAGVSVSAINAVEVGTRAGLNLTAQTCTRLAKALGVTTDYLLCVDEGEESEPEPAELDLIGV
jgi:transcriptional regulator with XRE-family HTH domain